jgi:hypothetical protein
MYPSRARRPVWRDARAVLFTLILAGIGAVVLASVGASGPVRQGVRLDCGEGGQWDVTGTWHTVQLNNYTITWTFKQQGTSLTGKAALPPDEAARARYTGTVGQVKGSIVGDKLDVVVQWPRRTDGVVVRGRYVGTVEESASRGGKVDDGRDWDLANPSLKGTWTGTGAAACMDWPPLADPLVELPSVSNGCGPGVPSDEPQWADTSTYLKYPTTDPDGPEATVNFRAACNLHDAGYSGARVLDPLHGDRVFDPFTWTKEAVDLKFLRDMWLLCDRAFAGKTGWGIALRNCRGTGGAGAFGAESRYNAVRTAAVFVNAWKARPDLGGKWTSKADPQVVWTIRQNERAVTAIWQNGAGMHAAFKGIVITHNASSTIKGFAKITDGAKHVKGSMSWIFLSRSPNELKITGPGVSGWIVRSS